MQNRLILGPLGKIKASFHPRVDQDLVEEEEEQSVAEFIDFGQREPNEDGTGRWLLTPDRRTVRLVDMGCTKGSTTDCLLMMLNAFFGGKLVFELADCPISKRKQDYENRKLPGVKGKSVEIWSVLDKLIPELAADDYALVAITPWQLFEDEEGEGIEVLGRACGDRVAVVWVPSKPDLEYTFYNIVATALHEILHTCGFDHTTDRICLMNPSLFSVLIRGLQRGLWTVSFEPR